MCDSAIGDLKELVKKIIMDQVQVSKGPTLTKFLFLFFRGLGGWFGGQ